MLTNLLNCPAMIKKYDVSRFLQQTVPLYQPKMTDISTAILVENALFPSIQRGEDGDGSGFAIQGSSEHEHSVTQRGPAGAENHLQPSTNNTDRDEQRLVDDEDPQGLLRCRSVQDSLPFSSEQSLIASNDGHHPNPLMREQFEVSEATEDPEIQYPQGAKLAIVAMSLGLALLLFGLVSPMSSTFSRVFKLALTSCRT